MLRFGTQRLAIAVGLALMALLPTTAFAASTATESISGVEIGFPIACGPSGSGDSLSTFSGGASGTISGVWSASVCHTGLSTHGVAATIIGGRFRVSGFASSETTAFAISDLPAPVAMYNVPSVPNAGGAVPATVAPFVS